MKHLNAQYASTQTDLVEMGLDKNTMQDEFLRDHQLTVTGWYTRDPGSEDRSFRRFEQEEMEQVVSCLLRLRPTARVIDVKPTYGTVKEVSIMQGNSSVFRMGVKERASAIASQLTRDRTAQGFRLELVNLDRNDASPGVSLTLYKVEETDSVDFIPADVFIRWRKNF